MSTRLPIFLPTPVAAVAVAGCLRCLSIMAVDLDSEQAPQLLQSLSSELAELVSSPQTPLALSATCFNIMAQLASALASLAGAYQKQVNRLPMDYCSNTLPHSHKALASYSKGVSITLCCWWWSPAWHWGRGPEALPAKWGNRHRCCRYA